MGGGGGGSIFKSKSNCAAVKQTSVRFATQDYDEDSRGRVPSEPLEESSAAEADNAPDSDANELVPDVDDEISDYGAATTQPTFFTIGGAASGTIGGAICGTAGGDSVSGDSSGDQQECSSRMLLGISSAQLLKDGYTEIVQMHLQSAPKRLYLAATSFATPRPARLCLTLTLYSRHAIDRFF